MTTINQSSAKTLFEKIWEQHVVCAWDASNDLLYIDRHYIHEVTSPQAFAGLREHQRTVRRPDKTTATMDHNISTEKADLSAASPTARKQLQALIDNCKEFGIELFGIGHPNQGIVHVIGPESGLTQPGMTIVCGDSHTSTHGAFGALAFGIGTTEVEHVLATQTLPQRRCKTMRINVEGELHPLVSAKDLALTIIGKVGTAGGTGCVIEFAGNAIRQLSMEGRMTLCNMSIEMGAKAGLIAPDDKTFAYLEGRQFVPRDVDWKVSCEKWQALYSDDDAVFDKEVTLDASLIKPSVTWGTSPEQQIALSDEIPDPNNEVDLVKASAMRRALSYMGLSPGQKIADVSVDTVFIGSCTNSRIEDLRDAAQYLVGKSKQASVRAMVVPGSVAIKQQAEQEGLDKIFINAGFEWRNPGCSMCLGMNGDQIAAGERCASTSNRNFEGRQGAGGRTHLVSPLVAAATAVHGHFVDVSGS